MRLLGTEGFSHLTLVKHQKSSFVVHVHPAGGDERLASAPSSLGTYEAAL